MFDRKFMDIQSGYTRFMSVVAVLLVSCTGAWGAELTFQNERPGCPAVAVEPPRTSFIEMVYVVRNDGNLQAHYQTATTSDVHWQKVEAYGTIKDIPFSHNGNDTWVTVGAEDAGYIVNDGSRFYYFWIVNYNNHELRLDALEPSADGDCDRMALRLDGAAGKIEYLRPDRLPLILSRELTLEYSTMTYDSERMEYVPVSAVETLEYVDGTLRVTAPLSDTDFTLSGDRFLRAWGEEQSVTSPSVDAMAIAATTTATQTGREIDNEQKAEGGDGVLGGSGPVEIAFRAAVTDAVIYKEWQFSFDPTFDVIDLRIQENDVVRDFSDYGTTYVRFVAGNNDGSCDFTGETYEVFIGESKLDCPNAFSPDATPGVNDEWKVSYKSITDFDCHIFNRWGQEIIRLTHPSQGWDGKYKGKFVPAGVYYYVIKARGTDGVEYKLSGDINIIKYKEEGRRTSSGG